MSESISYDVRKSKKDNLEINQDQSLEINFIFLFNLEGVELPDLKSKGKENTLPGQEDIFSELGFVQVD